MISMAGLGHDRLRHSRTRGEAISRDVCESSGWRDLLSGELDDCAAYIDPLGMLDLCK